MNLRSMFLTLVALLGTAGCVSVEAGAERPTPLTSVRSGDAPAAQTSTPLTAPPAVHDALGKAEERPERGSGKRGEEGEGARTSARRPDAVGPPVRQEVRSRLRRVAPVPPEQPRRVQPRQTYDMRAVCATGQGVASSEIIDLCRTAYGR
jgi:hypothetical protein